VTGRTGNRGTFPDRERDFLLHHRHTTGSGPIRTGGKIPNYVWCLISSFLHSWLIYC